MNRLERFINGLDFSRDDDVKEYVNRVIKTAISLDAYNLLGALSLIEEEIDFDSVNEASFTVYPSSKAKGMLQELLDAQLIDRKGNQILWTYTQIRDAVFEDEPTKHKFAELYYTKKME
jgi:hypothetical protein